jgi:hypothetical protein
MGKGIASNPGAVIYELNGALALAEVGPGALHILNADRSLMVGDGGYSYTLNRTENAEEGVDAQAARSQPEMSYELTTVEDGPDLLGIFEGRTPCQGIARDLKMPVPPACTKLKWRVTLYRNAESLEPTTYKAEGGLFPGGPREGQWTLVHGNQQDANAIVYRLGTREGEPALLLLKGDDNVLFFLDQNEILLVGNSDYSYTLNRVQVPASADVSAR